MELKVGVLAFKRTRETGLLVLNLLRDRVYQQRVEREEHLAQPTTQLETTRFKSIIALLLWG